MSTTPTVPTHRLVTGSTLCALALLAGCPAMELTPAEQEPQLRAERAPIDVTLRTHADDGLPEGHPEIREFVQPLEDYYAQRLEARVTDYGQALRMASLKLRGNIPSLAEVRELQRAGDPQLKYKEMIKRFLDGKVKMPNGTLADDPRLKRQVLAFWRNTLKMGPPGNAAFGIVSQDSAPTMAAMVTVSDTMGYQSLFTLPSDQCWTMNTTTGEFTQTQCTCSSTFSATGAPSGSMNCYNGNAPSAGILGNPGFMAVNYGGLAFHRIKIIQEIFACRPHPAEPQGVWDQTFVPQEGTSAMPASPVNFASAESVVCAKCHQTMNRQAPLFANYDRGGVLRDRADLKTGRISAGGRNKTCSTASPFSCDFEVDTPTSPPRSTVIADYLTPSFISPVVRLGWRVNATVNTSLSPPEPLSNALGQFGQKMAEDIEVQRCLVNRLWYWTMSRQDIVNDPVRPPLDMTTNWVSVLNMSQHPFDNSPGPVGSLKRVMWTMLTSDDYTRF